MSAPILPPRGGLGLGLSVVKSLVELHGGEVTATSIGLPGLDGYGVARELRLHPRTAHVRLLALTGYGSEEDRLVSFLTPLDPVPPASGSATASARR